jgi:hypothetical protein
VEADVGAIRNKTTTQLISEDVASHKGLATNPNGRDRFDNESPDGGAGERVIQLRVQASVAGVGDVGWGNNDEEINSASLSLGSDTECMKKNICHNGS